MKLGLNLGSGQRRFESADGVQWVNIDHVSRPPDQVPDVVCDVGAERLPYDDETIDYCVLHQVLEHFGCGEADGVIHECYRVLKTGGSLIVTVPDLRVLAQRWLTREIDDYIFMVNVYGAYQGEEGDRHKWGYGGQGLWRYLKGLHKWKDVHRFNWRPIPGASLARDWWVLALECVK